MKASATSVDIKQTLQQTDICTSNLPSCRCGSTKFTCNRTTKDTTTCDSTTVYYSVRCYKARTMCKHTNSACCIILYLLFTCFSRGFTASIRNPEDLDDIIDLDHEYLTYGSYHNNDDVIDTIQYYFRSDKGDNYKPLRRNTAIDLSSPLCYVGSTSTNIICEYEHKQNTNFYRDEDNSVAMAITNENGTMKIRGIVNTIDATTEYEPLESEGLPSNRYHVIKKRWTANMVHKRSKRSASRRDKTGKQKKKSKNGGKNKGSCKTCGVSVGIQIGIGINSKTAKPYQPYPTGSKTPYKKLPDWVSDDGASCIDVLCVVDYSIYRKFKASEKSDKKAMQKIRYYYAHVINGMNMRYSTIAQKDLKINVRLAGYFIAKRPNDLSFIDANKMAKDAGYRVNSNYTLTELDSFLKRMQKRKKNVLPDFNHAMLFLDTTIGESSDHHIDESVYQYAFQHGEPKDGVAGDDGGTSFVSGICSDSKSTSLVVDHGAYTSSGIGTHELGHNLGVYWHDGEGTARGSRCNASLNYIMAPASYLIDEKNLRYSFTFSTCSTQQIKTHLDTLIKLNRNCLQCNQRDRKSKSDTKIDKEVENHLKILPGETDNVHTQCRQLYGQGSFMCPPNSPDEMCYRMYCYDPKRSACAIISEQMAATGTPCGRYKVCNMGKCVSDSKGKDVPDDCPYPDIPSYGAHCEDATPFMCKNDKFRQKCCNSCSKQLIQTGNSGVMIHIGVGSRLGPQAPSIRNQFGTSGGLLSNIINRQYEAGRRLKYGSFTPFILNTLISSSKDRSSGHSNCYPYIEIEGQVLRAQQLLPLYRDRRTGPQGTATVTLISRSKDRFSGHNNCYPYIEIEGQVLRAQQLLPLYRDRRTGPQGTATVTLISRSKDRFSGHNNCYPYIEIEGQVLRAQQLLPLYRDRRTGPRGTASITVTRVSLSVGFENLCWRYRKIIGNKFCLLFIRDYFSSLSYYI
ncbi:uncharacterized protein LOC132712852 [Ruditapes philippinarum]|uniref:uncharacterized protein LOC132712852 n=1 Tax=Ruditapes philippinarum TaxID=129788 RepID=UPI00295C3A67|nr:uncharacterized protein LOC132712852 [Ruditapes philippinarum]